MSRGIDWQAVLIDAKARGLHRSALARELRVSTTMVCTQCTLWEIDLPRGLPGQTPKADWPTVLAAAEKAGKTLGDVARETGVSKPAVHKHATRLGVKLRDGRHSAAERAA